MLYNASLNQWLSNLFFLTTASQNNILNHILVYAYLDIVCVCMHGEANIVRFHKILPMML